MKVPVLNGNSLIRRRGWKFFNVYLYDYIIFFMKTMSSVLYGDLSLWMERASRASNSFGHTWMIDSHIFKGMIFIWRLTKTAFTVLNCSNLHTYLKGKSWLVFKCTRTKYKKVHNFNVIWITTITSTFLWWEMDYVQYFAFSPPKFNF